MTQLTKGEINPPVTVSQTRVKTQNRFPNCLVASNSLQFRRDQQLIKKANAFYAHRLKEREAKIDEFTRKAHRKKVVERIVKEIRAGAKVDVPEEFRQEIKKLL